MNNLTWTNFKKFRDIILNGSDCHIEKINFITFQYHDIINNKKTLLKDVEKIINNTLNNFIENFSKKNILIINSFENLNDSLDENHVRFNIIEESPKKDDFFEEKIHLMNIYKKDIKELLYNCFKESFKFNGGLSDNISKIEILNDTIKNIINYYFENNIKNIEVNFEKNEFKNRILYELIDKISSEIIKSHGNNVNDYSPSVNDFINNEKISLFERVQKIFLKFVIKYFDNENNIELIINKLNIKKKIKNNILTTDLLVGYLNSFITMNKVYKNYNKYKLFYTGDDFREVK